MGTTDTRGVYTPTIGEAAWGSQMNTNLALLSAATSKAGHDLVVNWDGTTAEAILRDGTIITGSSYEDVFNQGSARLTAFGWPDANNNYYAFPPAPTLVSTGAGVIPAGDYKYAISYYGPGGESVTGPQLSVTTLSTSNITISLPVHSAGSDTTKITGRKIYRSMKGGTADHGTGGTMPLFTDGRDASPGELMLVATIANNSATSYTDSMLDPSGNSAQDAKARAADRDTHSDGGSVLINRSTPGVASPPNPIGSIKIGGPLQGYSGFAVRGNGRGTIIGATPSGAGAYMKSIGTTTMTSNAGQFSVTETTTPPPVPFLAMVGDEAIYVMSRIYSGSGSVYYYNRAESTDTVGCTTVRGYFETKAVAHTSATVYVAAKGGRDSVGAMIDLSDADRISYEGLELDGAAYGNTAIQRPPVAFIQHRNDRSTSTASGLGGPTSWNRIGPSASAFNTQAIGFAISKWNDKSATTNTWFFHAYADIGLGVGIGIFTGDAHVMYTNVTGGGLICEGTTFLTGCHLASNGDTNLDADLVFAGAQVHAVNCYFDKPPSTSKRHIRPYGSGVADFTMVGCHFNGGTGLDMTGNSNTALVIGCEGADTLLKLSTGNAVKAIGNIYNTALSSSSTMPQVHHGNSKSGSSLVDYATIPTTATKNVTAVSAPSGTSYTFTANGHGMSAGETVLLAGFVPSGYNGSYTVTSATGNTFTVNIGSNPGTVTTLGTEYRAPHDNFISNPEVGNMILDTTNNKLFVRTAASTWKSVAVT